MIKKDPKSGKLPPGSNRLPTVPLRWYSSDLQESTYNNAITPSLSDKRVNMGVTGHCTVSYISNNYINQ